MDKKGLDYEGFRSMVAWMVDKINKLFANIIADYNANIIADYNANIKKQIICSDAEYLEMYNAGTLEADKMYIIFQEEKES